MAAPTSTSEPPSEGPVLSFINKRIRALRKKQNRIIQMEDSLSQGKTLNKEQQETLRSKPGVFALIDELEKLRAPLSLAVDEEVSLALQEKASAGATAEDVAAPTVSGGGDSVEDLLNLIYFGSLFDVMPQSDFTSMMLTKTHERGCCLTYDTVTDDATDLLAERDLDLIAALKGLLISRPLSESLSHKSALQRCIQHAKLWLAKSDQPIAPDTTVTYAALGEKLGKILSSDYYTTTPEMRGSVEMAAAAGVASFGSFAVPIHTSATAVSMPGQIEDSTVKYQEEEPNVNHEEFEASGEHQSAVPVEEFEKVTVDEWKQEENKTEEVSYEAEQAAEVEQQKREVEPQGEGQYGGGPRRQYQNNRGRGRGYSNGRGGRGSGRGGGQYQNGRGGGGGQYYDQGGNYYHRSSNGNYRGRGGGGRGGSSHYNYNQSSGMQAGGAYTHSNVGPAS